MNRLVLTLLVLLATAAIPAGAVRAACPPPPDHSDALSDLFARVRAAESEAAARPIAAEMWRYWADAPDAAAQALLDRGMAARARFDLTGALDAFDRLVRYCPDYAEGYNQRALVNFLRQDYVTALPDLDATLDRAPRHVGALSGKALTLFGLDRDAEARAVLREALKLNPWLAERHLLRTGTDL